MTPHEESLLAQLSLTCTEARQAFARHIGISQTRLQLLMLLSHDETSHAVLQQRLALDGATLTRNIKAFEADGLVKRRFDPQDNRYTLVTLTDVGQQIVDEYKATHSQFEARLLDGITPKEQRLIRHALQRLRDNIRAVQEEKQEQQGD